ncbi:MAG: hypothetical protein P1U42_01765 [Phycisphaerales bacterium]|nr:hypothetical protein [Phycisphaerales bacterium]
MKKNPNNNSDLHLHDDPELIELESMLDELATQNINSVPTGFESRLLDAVSSAIAPAPISIPSSVEHEETDRPNRLWTLRIAAAAVLATGTTIVIVSSQPWANSPAMSQSQMVLTSLEQDFDDYFALESVDDGNLSEALAEWEIWAQSVGSEMDLSLSEMDWEDSDFEGGAL